MSDIIMFEVWLNTPDEPGNVLVSIEGDRYRVDGIAVEPVWLPREPATLEALSELVTHLLEWNNA